MWLHSLKVAQLLRSAACLHANQSQSYLNHLVRELLDHFGWEVFDHPPYSPDLVPSDYHLFPNMKTWFATQRFDDDAELQAGVNVRLKSQAAKFYDDGINKLVHRYDKCLNLNGDYVEKWFKIVAFKFK